ncbi:MAG TPA: hypothetical protein VF099_15310, partial [Ktedonobacterales bacterium]
KDSGVFFYLTAVPDEITVAACRAVGSAVTQRWIQFAGFLTSGQGSDLAREARRALRDARRAGRGKLHREEGYEGHRQDGKDEESPHRSCTPFRTKIT